MLTLPYIVVWTLLYKKNIFISTLLNEKKLYGSTRGNRKFYLNSTLAAMTKKLFIKKIPPIREKGGGGEENIADRYY